MSYQIEVLYPKKFIKKVMNSWWIEQHLKGYLFYISIPFLTLVLMLVSQKAPLVGIAGLFTGFLSGIVFTLLFMLWWSYRGTQQQIRKMLLSLKESPIHYQFDEEGVEYSAAEYLGSFRWSAVTRLSRKPAYWQLHFALGREITLPLEALDEEVQAFIIQNLTRWTSPTDPASSGTT